MRHANHWMIGNELHPRRRLSGSTTANVAIIGGGMAGLMVADELVRRGVDGIAVIEARFCGAGASGRSSGFITPASELGLSDLQRRFGDEDARRLWEGARAGCLGIRQTIERNDIDCGYVEADSLYVASDERSFRIVEKEHEAFRQLGYVSRLHDATAIRDVIGSDTYGGGVEFGDTFGIDAFACVRGWSERLEESGVSIYEDSPVLAVAGDQIETAGGRMRAKSIFFCLDYAAGDLGVARSGTYHAQTFLSITEPLSDAVAASLFPRGARLVWDTDLIYQYFRLTADRRLLVGGGLLSKTYGRETNDPSAVERFAGDVRRRFPQLEGARFETWWQGMIGVTKDLLPLAGRVDGAHRYSIAACAAGLPWSVLAARVAVEEAFDGASDLARFFRPRRGFTEIDLLQPFLRKPLTFALSHAYAKWFLRGDERAVSRRKHAIAGAVVAGAAALMLLRKKRKPDDRAE